MKLNKFVIIITCVLGFSFRQIMPKAKSLIETVVFFGYFICWFFLLSCCMGFLSDDEVNIDVEGDD